MKKSLSLLLAFILIATLFTACAKPGPSGDATPTPGGNATPGPKTEPYEISVQVGPEPDNIDPAHNEAVDGATLIVHAFEGLYKLDKDGIPQPGTAVSYELSDDKLTYTFKLRDGLKWNDGSDLTAEDFVYGWKRAASTETAAPYGYMFDVVAGYPDNLEVKAIDAKTIEVKLAAPCPYFLELTAFPTYSPIKKDVVEGNESWATSPETYISNGPYKLVEWTHNSEMIFEKNEHYYDYESLGPDKIRFVLMEDDVAILSAFQNGEILLADSMPNDEIAAWKDKPEFNIAGQLGTYFVCFQTQKAPFDDPRVRKALSLAIDREYITVNIGQAGQQPAGAYVATGLSGKDPTKEFRDEGGNYYDPTSAGYEANVEEARRLLAEAGYPNGEGFPVFEYLYNESTGHQQIAEALQQMWKEELGIECTLASQEWGTFLNTRQNGDYQVARHGWLGDYNDPISFLDMWVTGGGNNDAKWSNAEYDEKIKTVKSTDDRDIRYTAMHEAEDILMEEMPVAPIYYYVDIYLKSEKLQGFYSSPLGYKYFMYATLSK